MPSDVFESAMINGISRGSKTRSVFFQIEAEQLASVAACRDQPRSRRMDYDTSVGPSYLSTGLYVRSDGPASKADFVTHWLCGPGSADVVTEFQEGIN